MLNQSRAVYVVLIFIIGGALLLSAVLLQPVLNSVNQSKVQILNLFLDIPENSIRILYLKSEKFLSAIQVGEDQDDMATNIDEDEQATKLKTEDIFDEENLKKKSKKRFRHKSSIQFKILFYFLICCAMFEAYFIATYYIAQSAMDQFTTQVSQANHTSYTEVFFIWA